MFSGRAANGPYELGFSATSGFAELGVGQIWVVGEATGMRDAARALVPAGSGLAVEAINEHETPVAACRS